VSEKIALRIKEPDAIVELYMQPEASPDRTAKGPRT
jgi:hypothetical protein